MNKLFLLCVYILLLLLLTSCSTDPQISKMEQIKNVGNDNPELALAMLDSIELDARAGNSYVQNKYDLLKVRLEDKADILPSSDLKIKKLTTYFERNGSRAEKQEVYYYAGSVYRDLQDTPRALENFFKSIDYALDNTDCDSIMLRNTYSNLHYLQYSVQNYVEAVLMAQKEAELSEKLGQDDVISYMHVAAAYKAIGNEVKSKDAYNKALKIISQSKDKSQYQEASIRLLMDYSTMNEVSMARACMSYINTEQPKYLSVLKNMAYASFYKACGNRDSSIIYWKRVIEDESDANNMYDAAKQLYHTYSTSGDIADACHYADIYMQLSDSLDFGHRQELAANVNNAYQYHLDEKKEKDLKDRTDMYKFLATFLILSSVLFVSIAFVIHIRRKNKYMQEVMELSSRLKSLIDSDKQLRGEIAQKETELNSSKDLLTKSNEELNRVKQKYNNINKELEKYDKDLKEKEQQLSDRMAQNKAFIRLLHQSELEGKAEDVIHAVRQTSAGKKNMSVAEWNQLYNAVDELYPNFRNTLLENIGTFTEQQMQLCYLMRIGLSKPQIQNMTNLSRVTVWRWVKKYDWALSPEDDKLSEG